jgi:hypothetical protein
MTADKEKLIKEYREMANFSEIADALDDICDEAISVDDEGEIASLRVNNEKISDNENMMKNLQLEYDYVMEKVLDFNNNAFILFRKFYVEAELFGEMVINPSNPKDGLQTVVLLPAETMFVDYNNYEAIKEFKQKMELNDPRLREKAGNDKGIITLKNNEVAYVNSGIISKSSAQERLVLGFLDRARVAYRQLKWMEDALLIYRLVRAPERRVFTINVGNLPTNKVNEYMKNIIQRFKQKKVYNSQTGEIDVGKNVQSMQEDIFLPQRADGSGPKVETLKGGENLGEIGDVILFIKKLYKALKVPTKRIDENDMNDWMGEVTTREEVKFAKYVVRVRNIFNSWLMQIFVTHLQLKGLWDQYHLEPEDISIEFNEDNEWRESKKLANLQKRVTMFNELSSMQRPVFGDEWLKKQILKMTDKEIEENTKQLKKQKEEDDKEKAKQLKDNLAAGGDGADPDEKFAEDAEKKGQKLFQGKTPGQKIAQFKSNQKATTMPTMK